MTENQRGHIRNIGKIQYPRSHKLKPSPLLPDEWVTMQSHAELGAKKLARGQSPYLRMDAVLVALKA